MLLRCSIRSAVVFGLVFLTQTIRSQNVDVPALLAQVPSCALPCALDSVQKINCDLTNLGDCFCTNITLLLGLSSCVQTSCDVESQLRAVLLENQVCKSYPKPSRSHEVKAVAIALSAVTFPLVALRCVSRWRVTGKLWADDWAALVAGLFLAAIAALEIVSSELGFGKHYWNVKPTNGSMLLKLFYAVQMFYIVVQVMAKASILLLFMRVFTQPRFTLICKLFIGFLFAHGLAFLFAIIFQCSPIQGIWDRTLESKCVNLTAVGFIGSGFSIVEDFVILILPIPELKTLSFSIKKRISLSFMFGIGSFACVTSIVRLKYLIDFRNSLDSTWDNVDIVLWSLAELCTALICGCLPSLRPLLVRCLPFIFKNRSTNARQTPDASYRLQNGNAGKFHGLQEEDESELSSKNLKCPTSSEYMVNKPLPVIHKA